MKNERLEKSNSPTCCLSKDTLAKSHSLKGILLVDKSPNNSSFFVVNLLRRLTNIKKIGHAGTLDPFATGLMIYLIGKEYTTKSDLFLNKDKEYIAICKLGSSTNTFDIEGEVQNTSSKIPTQEEIEIALQKFQGTILQTPPMFSAKKIQGQKLYNLARKGIEVERKPVEVTLQTELISYNYPYLELKISCSKGTYIRSIADDLGKILGCYAHLTKLVRTRIGPYTLDQSITQKALEEKASFSSYLIKKIL